MTEHAPSTRKNAETTRGKPFEPGNSGRTKGSRNKATLALEALLDGEAEALTRKAIEMALEGDTTAMRLVMDRIMPPRKDRPVLFALPKLETPADAVKATAALVEAADRGFEFGQLICCRNMHEAVQAALDAEAHHAAVAQFFQLWKQHPKGIPHALDGPPGHANTDCLFV